MWLNRCVDVWMGGCVGGWIWLCEWVDVGWVLAGVEIWMKED